MHIIFQHRRALNNEKTGNVRLRAIQWCILEEEEFEEDWLKTLLCRVHTRKNEVGPLVATNVTNQWTQSIGVQTMAQRILGVYLEKIN